MKNKYFFEGLAFVAPNSYFIYNKFLNKAIKGKLYSKFNKIKNMNYILNLLPESFYKKYYRMYGFGDNTIVKFAGLFDPPKKILCPNIFSLTNALYPHVREQILNLVYKLVPKEYIKGVLLIGTSVGYQWSDDSDIDVNILVYPHDIITEELNLKRHQLNSLNNYLVGTKHIINLYVSPWVKEQNWQDNPFGVYDVLNDKWVSFPSSNIRNPADEYELPLIYANMVYRNYIKYFYRYKKALRELQELESKVDLEFPELHQLKIKRKAAEVKQREIDLINFVKSLDSSRKFEYYYGWGTPRKNYRNILYKLIEHLSKNKNIKNYFDYFRELRFKDNEKLPWEVKIIV